MSRIIVGLFLALSSGLLSGGSADDEHVHFKIHLPEVINHEVHTKTVFVHLHKPVISLAKKLKQQAPTYRKRTRHEDWSSWNSYHEEHHNHDDQPNNALRDHRAKEPASKKPFVSHQREMSSYSAGPQHDDKPKDGGMRGYSYPPQYAVREHVREADHNSIEPYTREDYEEGYERGGESANGHVYSGGLTKFYDEKHEEGNHSAEEYTGESTEKTHAARYFIDDVDYRREHEPEKRAVGTF